MPQDNYKITVIDSNGCRQSTNLEIKGPKLLESILSVLLPSSDSTNDGQILSNCLGGTPPYQYLWSNSETSSSIDNLGLGNYILEVTDSKGCKSKESVEINQIRTCNDCYPFDPQCHLTHLLICSTCITTFNLNIEDFGADGSDDQSDQCAFEEISNYVNSLHPDAIKEITIPPGTYYVGRQLAGLGGFYLDGVGVLCFNNTNNVTINRNPNPSGNAILKFSNCMKYGAFDIPANPDNRFLSDCGRMITCTLTAGSTTVTYTGTPIDPSFTYDVWDPDPTRINAGTTYIIGSAISNLTSTTFTIATPPSNITGTVICNLGIISNCRIVGLDYSKLAGCGNMIHLNFCRNISINNLELDGNIDNAIIGGGGAADGLQIAYDAIFINASNDITINNINEHHFGHDGLWLRYVDCDFPVTASTDDMNCHIINSKFQYNGRNALSWTGGSLLRCYNSEFSFSGQSRIASSPAAGMDIEFEPRGYYSQGTSDGTFVNCKFRYNRQHGFISDCELDERFDVHSFLFDGCDFVAGESTDCVWPRAADCYFLNCNMYGLMQCPFSNSTLLTNFDAQNDCILENCFFAENYKDRDPLAPIECQGIHSFSSTESETEYSGGVWIPGTNCPLHKAQIDFSNATRVMFLGGLSEQQFSNRCMILGTSLSVNPPPEADWNSVSGTIFASNGMNFCGCERLQVSINYTKIGLGHIYFRWVTPWRYTSAPCNPWQDPFSYLEPSTKTAADDPLLYGVSYTGHYSSTTNPVFELEDYVPKFLNINDVHSEMPLLQSPCLSTPAFVPLTCLPPARIKHFNNSEQTSILSVSPTISTDKITIKSYPTYVNCQIINSLGEIVLNSILIDSSKEIDVSSLKSGFYIIKSDIGSFAKFIKN